MATKINKKVFFWGAVVALLIGIVKNVQAVVQIINRGTITAIDQGAVGAATTIILFIVIGAQIQNTRWRICWAAIVLNELLNILAIRLFKSGSLLAAMTVVFLGIMTLFFGAVILYRE